MKPSTAASVLSPVIFGLSGCNPKPAPPAPADGRRNLLPPPGATSIAALSQGWTEAQAADFYTRPQGSRMIPYDIFRNIEQAGSENLFRTPENFQRLGYLARVADAQNPDALPVGFVKDGDHVGMTCAACHTSVLTHNKKALVIDGGGTLADAQTMITELSAAMQATLADAAKFERFQMRMGTGKGAEEIRQNLQAASTKLAAYVARNFPKPGQPAAGHGRLDAFDAIFNEVAVRFAANPQAEVRSDAPVSYPFLWDTPQHDRVQWNGSATNTELPVEVPGLGTKKVGALGRNVGEVLGVFADVARSSAATPIRSIFRI